MNAHSSKIKILLVEDNMNLSENISEQLRISGYEVCGIFDSAEEAKERMMEKAPNLVLIDIKLKGEKTGIELAAELRGEFKLPFVFITSASGKEVISKVEHLKPDGFIVKPFSKESLVTSIELALSNFKQKEKVQNTNVPANILPDTDEIFIRDNGWLKKIRTEDINWIKAEGTYTQLYVDGKQYTLRNTTKEILEKLNEDEFVRVHKCFIVNLKKIEAFNSSFVRIQDSEIPIGRNYYKELVSMVNKVSG